MIEEEVRDFEDAQSYAAFMQKFFLSRWVIEKLRKHFRRNIEEDAKKTEKEAKKRLKSFMEEEEPEPVIPVCSREWPTCSFLADSKEKIKNGFFLFRSPAPIVLNNYFTEKPNRPISVAVNSFSISHSDVAGANKVGRNRMKSTASFNNQYNVTPGLDELNQGLLYKQIMISREEHCLICIKNTPMAKGKKTVRIESNPSMKQSGLMGLLESKEISDSFTSPSNKFRKQKSIALEKNEQVKEMLKTLESGSESSSSFRRDLARIYGVFAKETSLNSSNITKTHKQGESKRGSESSLMKKEASRSDEESKDGGDLTMKSKNIQNDMEFLRNFDESRDIESFKKDSSRISRMGSFQSLKFHSEITSKFLMSNYN